MKTNAPKIDLYFYVQQTRCFNGSFRVLFLYVAPIIKTSFWLRAISLNLRCAKYRCIVSAKLLYKGIHRFTVPYKKYTLVFMWGINHPLNFSKESFFNDQRATIILQQWSRLTMKPIESRCCSILCRYCNNVLQIAWHWWEITSDLIQPCKQV